MKYIFLILLSITPSISFGDVSDITQKFVNMDLSNRLYMKLLPREYNRFIRHLSTSDLEVSREELLEKEGLLYQQTSNLVFFWTTICIENSTSVLQPYYKAIDDLLIKEGVRPYNNKIRIIMDKVENTCSGFDQVIELARQSLGYQ